VLDEVVDPTDGPRIRRIGKDGAIPESPRSVLQSALEPGHDFAAYKKTRHLALDVSIVPIGKRSLSQDALDLVVGVLGSPIDVGNRENRRMAIDDARGLRIRAPGCPDGRRLVPTRREAEEILHLG